MAEIYQFFPGDLRPFKLFEKCVMFVGEHSKLICTLTASALAMDAAFTSILAKGKEPS
jgi:hypothetical protein